jgi:hypothetical protein
LAVDPAAIFDIIACIAFALNRAWQYGAVPINSSAIRSNDGALIATTVSFVAVIALVLLVPIIGAADRMPLDACRDCHASPRRASPCLP